MSCGIAPGEFWDLTYRELFALFTGRNLASMRAHKLALFESWHTAAFYRSKKLPVLGDMLRKLEPPRVMSRREMRAAIIGVAQALGASVRRIKKGEA